MAVQLPDYYPENEIEDKVEKYTFVVTSFFRKKDAPSVDAVISSLVCERAKRTIANNSRGMVG